MDDPHRYQRRERLPPLPVEEPRIKAPGWGSFVLVLMIACAALYGLVLFMAAKG